jgi:hypothetical protein
MPELPKIWDMSITDIRKLIMKGKLNISSLLENWLEKNMAYISPTYLLIGSKVQTEVGGIIDLLCLDKDGNTIVIEFTPPNLGLEITEQHLADALWVKQLSTEQLTNIANNYLGKAGDLATAFWRNFGEEIPATINSEQKIVTWETGVDNYSAREGYFTAYFTRSFPIDVDAFNQYRDTVEWTALVMSSFVELTPYTLYTYIPIIRNRKTKFSYEELEEMAEKNGVLHLFQTLVNGLVKCRLPQDTAKTWTRISFKNTGARQRIFLYVDPGESNPYQGLKFEIYINRLAEFLGVSQKDVATFLPKYKIEGRYSDADVWGEGFFQTEEQVNILLEKILEVRNKKL